MDIFSRSCGCGFKFSDKTSLFCTQCGTKRVIYTGFTEAEAAMWEKFADSEAYTKRIEIPEEPELDEAEYEPEPENYQQEEEGELYDDGQPEWDADSILEYDRKHNRPAESVPSVAQSFGAGFLGGLIGGYIAGGSGKQEAMPVVMFEDGTPVVGVTKDRWGGYKVRYGYKGLNYFEFTRGSTSGNRGQSNYQIIWPE